MNANLAGYRIYAQTLGTKLGTNSMSRVKNYDVFKEIVSFCLILIK